VPLLDLRGQYAAIKDEIDEAIRGVVESQRFVLGPEVGGLEQAIAEYCHTRFAVGCASGSDAILLALMAHGVGPGDEVICPAYTFFSTAGSIARLQARPVFADIDPVSYNLEPESVRAAARRCRRLAAIMPVHLFGRTADMETFVQLGRELGVPVVEDAAQALGSRDRQGHPAGSRGSIGCFSCYPSKNLGGYGDGGMLTTNDEALAERLSALRVHGERTKYRHGLIGMNSRLDALQAAILRVKLRHLARWTEARQANAAHYDRVFAGAGAATSTAPRAPADRPLRTPQPPDEPATHIYNQYVIRVPADLRDPLRDHLGQVGIGTEIYYPVPLHRQECFGYLGGAEGDLPISESAAAETVALPIYPELTRDQLDLVANAVIAFLNERARSPEIVSRRPPMLKPSGE
jgi:dTDP-4-amino-4,6-dideoxygalactose transaminase